uniref:Uncharacterized protein n=1 Tax=Arundo donax TaxID=35708 RepID=A0A0A9HGR7_ARUDO
MTANPSKASDFCRISEKMSLRFMS